MTLFGLASASDWLSLAAVRQDQHDAIEALKQRFETLFIFDTYANANRYSELSTAERFRVHLVGLDRPTEVISSNGDEHPAPPARCVFVALECALSMCVCVSVLAFPPTYHVHALDYAH